jgi:hypothetical protein
MSIPLTGWQNGAWNHLVPEFNRLGAMIGLDPNPSAQTLYAAIGKTGSAKLFEQNVASFLEATGMQIEGVASELRHIEGELGLMSTLPFMSLKQGIVDPASFEGVAILTAGTANYIEARIEQIKLAIRAGARITRVVCLASSRVMDGVADKKHPVVADPDADWGVYGQPTEVSFQRLMVTLLGLDSMVEVKYANLPQWAEPPSEEKPKGRPLNLEQQLNWLVKSGQYADLIGDSHVYFPVNFNATFIVLEARRVLGLDDIYTSSNGGTLIDALPKFWAPTLQHVLTWPNGALRLWKELVAAGMIDYSLIAS